MRRFALLVVGLALLAGVAATVSGEGRRRGARWVITDLGTLGWPTESDPVINERGQVVVSSRRVFLWATRHHPWSQDGHSRVSKRTCKSRVPRRAPVGTRARRTWLALFPAAWGWSVPVRTSLTRLTEQRGGEKSAPVLEGDDRLSNH